MLLWELLFGYGPVEPDDKHPLLPLTPVLRKVTRTALEKTAEKLIASPTIPVSTDGLAGRNAADVLAVVLNAGLGALGPAFLVALAQALIRALAAEPDTLDEIRTTVKNLEKTPLLTGLDQLRQGLASPRANGEQETEAREILRTAVNNLDTAANSPGLAAQRPLIDFVRGVANMNVSGREYLAIEQFSAFLAAANEALVALDASREEAQRLMIAAEKTAASIPYERVRAGKTLIGQDAAMVQVRRASAVAMASTKKALCARIETRRAELSELVAHVQLVLAVLAAHPH